MSNKPQPTIFDLMAATQLKERGIEIAEKGNIFLELARDSARSIAATRGRVTADDVIREMLEMGYQGDELGNAAGALFKKGFKKTGEYVPCERVNSHARAIAVWRLA